MKLIELLPQTPEQISALLNYIVQQKDVRLRHGTQLVLLAVEKGPVATEVGRIMSLNEQHVRRWLKRYVAGGLNCHHDFCGCR